MNNQVRTITPRYAALHGGFQASYSLVVGYASVYLLSKGYSNAAIGIILSVSNAAAAILQPLLGSFLDRSKKVTLQAFSCILLFAMMGLSILLLITAMPVLPLSVVMILIMTMLFLLQPLVNSLCFLMEHAGIHINFGFCRGIGSITYAVASVAVGRAVAIYHEPVLPLIYVLFFAGFVIVFLSLRKVPTSRSSQDDPQGNTDQAMSLLQFVKTYKRFIVFLIGSTLIFFMLYLTGNFFCIQIVTAIGGGTTEMGISMALAAAVELPVMACLNKLNKRIPLYRLLRISVIFFMLKLLFIVLARSIPMFYVAQLFQMGSYAIFYPGATIYINRLLPPADLVKGQSLLTTMFTLSGILASLIGGLLLNITTAANMLFISFLIALAGAFITWFSIEKVN